MCRSDPPPGPTHRDPHTWPYQGYGPHWSTPATRGRPGHITGRRHKLMCQPRGGQPSQPSKRQWAPNRDQRPRKDHWRDWTGSFVPVWLVGHAFAEVLRGRMTLAAWWRYETTLSAHQEGCRYARTIRALSAVTQRPRIALALRLGAPRTASES